MGLEHPPISFVERRRNHFTTAPRQISVSVNHCGDFSDELDCNPDHPSSYRCADSDVSDVFVPVEKLCDGKRDCPYVYLDQFRCKLCLPHEIECEDGNGCIPMGGGGGLCDGTKHCEDGSDESSYYWQCPMCESDEFECIDGSGCVPKSKKCDRTPNCDDGSDEKYC